MKAIRIHEHGSVDVLKIEDLAIPEPGKGEVRLRVKCAALNHLDVWVRNGIPGVPLPIIMGNDAAGIVDAIGPDVTMAAVGDEVINVPIRVPHGDPLIALNRENLSPEFSIPGEHMDGTQAEYIIVPQNYVLPKPRPLNWEEAAAFPLVGMTAFHMLMRKEALPSGSKLLVYGASSGVGHMAVQIAKALGHTVITTAGSDEKVQQAKKLGADHVIHYKKEPIGKTVREITGGLGVDLVLEHPGAATWKDSLRSLKTGGAIVTCGATTGPKVEIDLRAVFIKHQKIIGSTMGTLQDMKEVCHMIEQGSVRPVVSKVYDYESIREAHEELETGDHFGKLVIRFP